VVMFSDREVDCVSVITYPGSPFGLSTEVGGATGLELVLPSSSQERGGGATDRHRGFFDGFEQVGATVGAGASELLLLLPTISGLPATPAGFLRHRGSLLESILSSQD
jgi:hypothetical protein